MTRHVVTQWPVVWPPAITTQHSVPGTLHKWRHTVQPAACRLCNMSDMKEGVKNFCFKQILNIYFFPSHAFKLSSRDMYRPLHTTHVVWEPEPGGQHRSVGPGPWRRWPVGVTLHGVTGHMWHFVTVTQTCSPYLTYTIKLGECWMCSIMISHFRNIKYLARKDPHWHGDA